MYLPHGLVNVMKPKYYITQAVSLYLHLCNKILLIQKERLTICVSFRMLYPGPSCHAFNHVEWSTRSHNVVRDFFFSEEVAGADITDKSVAESSDGIQQGHTPENIETLEDDTSGTIF